MLRDFKISFYVNSHIDKLFEKCVEGQWVWDDDKREQRRWVNWVMGRVTKVELAFLCSEVEVGWFREGGWWRWYKFNALVSAWEERRRDEALSEDEAETACSSWLNRKKMWHSAVAWWRQWEEMRYRGGKGRRRRQLSWRESFLGWKIKKNHPIDLAATNERWRFKGAMSYLIFKKIYASEI
jgi:hypothetical protein